MTIHVHNTRNVYATKKVNSNYPRAMCVINETINLILFGVIYIYNSKVVRLKYLNLSGVEFLYLILNRSVDIHADRIIY